MKELEDNLQSQNRYQALITIRHSVQQLHEMLNLETGLDLRAFQKVLDSKLIVQLDPDYPLMVAITGGGCSGKSSLFNAIVGKELSAVKARAGSSRRVLAAIHPAILEKPGFLASLFDAFDAYPEPLTSLEELTERGKPKYASSEEVPRNLVLLDTPDFDTGDQRNFKNRDIAKPVLEACDIFLYIVTNATYANRDNTQFIRETLTGVGLRKVILVYRCSRVISETEVHKHLSTVASNLYGEEYTRLVAGMYRVNEDDEVAAGKTLMRIDPISGCSPLLSALSAMDKAAIRSDFLAAALRDVRSKADRTLAATKRLREELIIYRDAVRIAASWASTEALKDFPKSEFLHRFLHIWEQTQPAPLKKIKGVGKVVGAPVKGMLWLTRKVRDRFWKDEDTQSGSACPDEVLRQNLFEAANSFRNRVLGLKLVVETTDRDPDAAEMLKTIRAIHAESPPGDPTCPHIEELGGHRINIHVSRPRVFEDPGAGNAAPSILWEDELQNIVNAIGEMPRGGDEFDAQIKEIILNFRRTMGSWEKAREVLTAALPSLALFGAGVCVFLTSSPVAGTGIYAHLTALFGLNDLFALAVIPAATGLNEADRKNLQALISPVFADWFGKKAGDVRSILEKRIAGSLLDQIQKLLDETNKPTDELARAIGCLPREES